MTTGEIATRLVDLCRAGKAAQAIELLYSPKIVSVEPFSHGPDFPAMVEGIEAVRAKNQAWAESSTLHELIVDGPFVADDQFAVRFTMDVTPKATGERIQATEMALYTVKDGKIVREEFYYSAT